MKKLLMILPVLAVILVFILMQTTSLFAKDLWYIDFEKAKKAASKEKKPMFVDFTGSDWCKWCIKLNKEVFNTDYFKKNAPKDFILVKLDYPREQYLPQRLIDQNERLRIKYQIQGYPTLLLMNADGVKFAKTGYRQGGPVLYLKHLKELVANQQKTEELLTKAKASKGIEKAKLLDKYVEAMTQAGTATGLESMIKEIIFLDKNNQAGLKAKYIYKEKLKDILATLNQNNDIDLAIKNLLSLSKEKGIPDNSKEEVFAFLGNVYLRGKNDKKNAIIYFKKAAAINPESEMSKSILAYIKQL